LKRAGFEDARLGTRERVSGLRQHSVSPKSGESPIRKRPQGVSPLTKGKKRRQVEHRGVIAVVEE
jgi:hypothetical protein